MGQVVRVYTDGKRHKHDMYKTRKERDAIVKQLRSEGWTVTVKKWNFDGDDRFTYEATWDK